MKESKMFSGEGAPQPSSEEHSNEPSQSVLEGSELENRVEVPNLEKIRDQEITRLTDFFGAEFMKEHGIEVPQIPEYVKPEQIERWKKQLFELRYLPKVNMDNSLRLPGWEHKPDWDRTTNGGYNDTRMMHENKTNPHLQDPHTGEYMDPSELPGAWILFDCHNKPDYGAGSKRGLQLYDRDEMIQGVIYEILESGIVSNELVPSASRFSIHPEQFGPTAPFWQEFTAKMREKLRLPPEAVVRLPRVIEANVVLGQHGMWHKTNTGEWCEEKFGHRNRVAFGTSSDGGNGVIGYNQAAAWIGFRPVVMFS
ncbi:MAG: hypothetical protein WC477_02690 [Patescibacteria group bacterium]